jgi:hypothetical protein
MAEKTWEVISIRYCDHIHEQVGLEAEIVYPADHLPDLEERILAHRCTRSLSCNLEDRGSCTWAGTNPAIDPFSRPL